LLELAEEALDQMTRPVQVPIIEKAACMRLFLFYPCISNQ
jgi:hypothetical protein